MIAAVVLAAGRSTRMGCPKAFLPHFSAGSTFLGHLIEAGRSGGADPVLVVGRPDDPALRAEVSRLGATFVENHEADRGQLSSLVAALDYFSPTEPDAIVVLPVDVPVITAAVVSRLISAAQGTTATIVRAAHQGRHGHPVLFRRSVFDELRGADPTTGARAVVRRDPNRVLDVETGEPGVLVDLDTPEDYERIFGRTARPISP
jgi:molybdenum cofactor cytidylyltransferase